MPPLKWMDACRATYYSTTLKWGQYWSVFTHFWGLQWELWPNILLKNWMPHICLGCPHHLGHNIDRCIKFEQTCSLYMFFSPLYWLTVLTVFWSYKKKVSQNCSTVCIFHCCVGKKKLCYLLNNLLITIDTLKDQYFGGFALLDIKGSREL